MNIDELKQVVAKVQLGDNRQVDRLVLEYWFELIGHLDIRDAFEGVNAHRRTSPGVWLEPGHVIAGARRAKETRLRAEQRASRPQIEPNRITLDREQFEIETQQAIEAQRRRKAEADE